MFYDTRNRHGHPFEDPRFWEARGHRGRGPRGPRRFGMHEIHRGRKFSSGDLQILILALLEKGPSYGYELIKSFEELSDGFYAPSPGVIYPALTYLEEIGYADVDVDGNRKRYRVTDQGTSYLNDHRGEAEEFFSRLEQIGSRMEDARRVFSGELDFEEEARRHGKGLMHMRKRLKDFMRSYEPKGPDDEQRLVEALQRALAEMEGGPVGRLRPENFLDIFARRRSMGLSRLKSDPVDRRLIESMLQAANWAPSHGDTEPWRFFVFSGEGREALATIFEQALREGGQDPEGGRKRAFAAPVWIAIGMSPQLAEDGSLVMSEEEEVMAVACAVQNLHLMASELGLVGMWHSKGLSVNPLVGQALGLESPARLLGFFMCGWPAVDVPAGERGQWSDKVTWFESLPDSNPGS